MTLPCGVQLRPTDGLADSRLFPGIRVNMTRQKRAHAWAVVAKFSNWGLFDSSSLQCVVYRPEKDVKTSLYGHVTEHQLSRTHDHRRRELHRRNEQR